MAIMVISKEILPLYPTIAAVFVPIGFYLDQKNRYPLSNKAITVATLVLVVAHLYGLRLEILYQRISQVLMLLVVAKLMATKQVRDYLQLALFSLMLMAASAVGQWGISFGVLLILHATLLMLGLLFLYASTEVNTVSRREAGTLLLWGTLMGTFLVPFSLLFFFLLPRPSVGFTPGWIGGKTVARSGFGDTVSPGAVESIKRDSSVAFRAELLNRDTPLPPHLLYWRGKVYGGYNKGRWFTLRDNTRRGHEYFHLSNQRVRYRVFLEPYDGNTLFVLGMPLRVRSNRYQVLWKDGYTIATNQPVEQRISYTVDSLLVEAIPAETAPQEYLGVPDTVKRALQHLANNIAPKQENPLEIAKAIQRYLRTNNGYTLTPEIKGQYPVVEFLLKGRKGHCEYFASAMAILLRLKKIPSRLVAGFMGGTWNPLGHYYLVKNSDAHTWVEVWVPWLGWVPFDPTPSSPEGIAQNRPNALQRLLDYLRFQWYHWIINYDYQKQVGLFQKGLELLSSPSISKPRKREISWKTIVFFSSTIFAILLALYLGKIWISRPRTWGEKLERILKEKGIERQAGETLLEVAQRLQHDNQQLSERLTRVVWLYYQLEFGNHKDDSELEKEINRLR